MSQVNEARPPRSFQFSLVMLLALMAWVAIVCIALKTPSPVWAAVVFLLSLLATLAGGLGILYRAGRARAFAVGFLAGCLGYAACLFITEKHFGGEIAYENSMPTTTFASWLFDRLHPESASMVGGMMGGGVGGSGMGGGGGPVGGGGFFSVDSSLGSEQSPEGGPDSDGDDVAQAVPANGGADSDGIDQAVPPGTGVVAGPATTVPPEPTIYYLKEFVVIVHSALATLLGLAGGIIAQFFYAAGRKSSAERGADGH